MVCHGLSYYWHVFPYVGSAGGHGLSCATTATG
jgi:hypothetical protein